MAGRQVRAEPQVGRGARRKRRAQPRRQPHDVRQAAGGVAGGDDDTAAQSGGQRGPGPGVGERRQPRRPDALGRLRVASGVRPRLGGDQQVPQLRVAAGDADEGRGGGVPDPGGRGGEGSGAQEAFGRPVPGGVRRGGDLGAVLAGRARRRLRRGGHGGLRPADRLGVE
ncbi:hypothetical protein ACSNOI_09690 [Actinomadura kijaniata]|uniref:hypothetical protein n=1 Tax=Actinomadura kijaniata TaxID=46161 RepID=UPI003F1CD669